jgi:hypothetical protein
MNTYCGARSSRPARLFSLGLLDVLLRVRLRRPHLREATAGFGLSRLATASIGNPGLPEWRALSRTLTHCLKSVQERATLTRPGERPTAGGT